jgi:hypothetical protein
VVHFWRRSSAAQALKWGSLDLEEQLQQPRKEFFGDKRSNPVTDKPELHYPWTRRIPAYLISFAVILASLVVLLAVTLMLFKLRHIVHRDFKDPYAPLYFQFINALMVELLNAQFSTVAKKLNDFENHRTLDEYQTHLLIKCMVFKFFNSYVSLYYIAFFKGHDTILGPKMRCRNNDCLVDLGSQMACFIFVRIVISNLVEILWPKVISAFRDWREEQAMRGLKAGSDILVYAGMSSMEMQAKKEKMSTYDEMEEILLTYGYCILFVTAVPWMPFVVLLAFFVETALDKTKLFRYYQRPWPVLRGSNEPWDTAFDIMGILAMLTNIGLVVFATDAFDSYTRTEKVTIFFVLENIILAARLGAGVVFPARPSYVDSVAVKRQIVVQKHLDCVESGADTQYFESAASSRVLILDRDEDNDDEED